MGGYGGGANGNPSYGGGPYGGLQQQTFTVQLVVTVPQFRAQKPAFADPNLYPDSMIAFWLGIASIMLNACRWGTLLPFGTILFVAHNCALEALQNQAAQAGGAPGLARGPISSETPGSVALGYAVEQAAEPRGGTYNLTQYGQQFIRFARLIGAGPIQIGAGVGAPLFGVPITGLAWSGPWDGPEGPGWGT